MPPRKPAAHVHHMVAQAHQAAPVTRPLAAHVQAAIGAIQRSTLGSFYPGQQNPSTQISDHRIPGTRIPVVVQRADDRQAPPLGKRAKKAGDDPPVAAPQLLVPQGFAMDGQINHATKVGVRSLGKIFPSSDEFKGHLFGAYNAFSTYGGATTNLVFEGKLALLNMQDEDVVDQLLQLAPEPVAKLLQDKIKQRQPLQWQTASANDQAVADWLDRAGYNGWFMRLDYDEIMVVASKVKKLKIIGSKKQFHAVKPFVSEGK